MRTTLTRVTLAVVATALTFPCVTASASTPPTIPIDKMPPAVHAAPDRRPDPPLRGGKPTPPYTLQDLEKSTLSNLIYYGILEGLQRNGTTLPLTETATNARPATTLLHPNLQPATDASFGSAVDATPPPDTRRQAEPAVITQRINNVDRTVTAYIQYEPPVVIGGPSSPHLQYAVTSDFGSFSPATMPPIGGYTYSGDPWLDENPYAGGIANGRIYCTGVAYNDLSNPQNYPNAVAIWHSDTSDNANFVTSAAIVDSRYSGGFLDKPAMAVSWHNGQLVPGVNDLGYVYVVYVSNDYTNNNTAIVLARSSDGGVTFPQKTVIAYGLGPTTGNSLGNPQVVVAADTGVVYVVWVDFSVNQIQMARSTDLGATFGAHEVVATATLSRGTLQYGIRALTAPMAKYNYRANTLDIVWHDITGNGADVEFAYKDAAGWHRPSVSVTQFTANDQFFPALDYNANGNVIITYYDRHGDLQNRKYRVYAAYVSGTTGARLDPADSDISQFDSNPPDAPVSDFIGDYQFVWDWTFLTGERPTAAWDGIQNANFDVWLSRLYY